MQDVFVHQIVLDQGMDQNTAAIHDDILAGPALQFADLFDDIAADNV